LAEGHGVPMAATVTPDVEDPAFLAQCLFATVADDNGLVFIACLAHFAFRYGDHNQVSLAGWVENITMFPPSDLNRWPINSIAALGPF
jgi:hypothetical protein